MSDISRRTLLVGGGAVVVLIGCHNSPKMADAEVDSAAGVCVSSNAKTVIADNHSHAPHALMVTPADIAAGVDKTYDIQGVANHNHQVTITAAQFAMLAAGGGASVIDTSTVAICHSHACTISC